MEHWHPNSDCFGRNVEIGRRDGGLTALAPWDHPFRKANPIQNGRGLANQCRAGLAGG
jgi:hypothetical protein